MDTNEAQRQARNVIRKGSILDVDHEKALCRVAIGDTDEDSLQTNWIPWITPCAGATREWLPPTLGEQVVLLCPMGDPAQGVVLRGIFSNAAPAPDNVAERHTRAYPDGARVTYNHRSHTLRLTLPADASVVIESPGSVTVDTTRAIVKAETVTLDAQKTTCNGAMLVKGPFAFESGMTGEGGDGGSVMRIRGSAELTGDVTAGGVSLIQHRHQAQGEFAITSLPLKGGA